VTEQKVISELKTIVEIKEFSEQTDRQLQNQNSLDPNQQQAEE
jgi:hypothetical protein